jgi:hypothetical protein
LNNSETAATATTTHSAITRADTDSNNKAVITSVTLVLNCSDYRGQKEIKRKQRKITEPLE